MCLRLPLCTLNVIFLHAQAIPAGIPFLFCNINLPLLLVRFHEYVTRATYYFPHFSTTIPQLYILFQVSSHFLLHCNPQMASSETFLFIFLNFFFCIAINTWYIIVDPITHKEYIKKTLQLLPERQMILNSLLCFLIHI